MAVHINIASDASVNHSSKKLIEKGKLAVLGCLGFLASCASAFDYTAYQTAHANEVQALQRCQERTDFKSNVDAAECNLAASLDWALAVKLNNLALYDVYAARVRLLAQQRDAGSITDEQYRKERETALAEYNSGLRREIASAQQQNADAQADFWRGFAQGSADQRARQSSYAAGMAASQQTGAATLCPNGTYVAGDSCQLAPDGSYVSGGKQIQLAPNGTYTAGQPQRVPNGTYTGPGRQTLCPNGTYVIGDCHLQPNGQYTGD